MIDSALRLGPWEAPVKYAAFRYYLACGQEVVNEGEERGKKGIPLGLVFAAAGEGDGVLNWQGSAARNECQLGSFVFLSALRETPEGSRNVVDGVIDGALRFDLWEVLLNNVAFRYDLAGG